MVEWTRLELIDLHISGFFLVFVFYLRISRIIPKLRHEVPGTSRQRALQPTVQTLSRGKWKPRSFAANASLHERATCAIRGGNRCRHGNLTSELRCANSGSVCSGYCLNSCSGETLNASRTNTGFACRVEYGGSVKIRKPKSEVRKQSSHGAADGATGFLTASSRSLTRFAMSCLVLSWQSLQ